MYTETDDDIEFLLANTKYCRNKLSVTNSSKLGFLPFNNMQTW